MNGERAKLFEQISRIVIKIGSNVVTTEQNRVDSSVIEHLVEQISDLARNRGRELTIVTSGAIAAGLQVLGWKTRPTHINELQAAASVGQSRLMRVYERSFRDQGLNVGQVLLTRDIFHVPGRKENARHTLLTLIKHRAIPIINENDSVAVDEIKFGDNDRLSALVAELIQADLLIMLSNVDGLHDADPKHSRRTRIIPEVRSVAVQILALGRQGTPSSKGSGGIASKIAAAKYVTDRGILCLIADGKRAGVLQDVFDGKKVGTLFYAKKGKAKA